MFNVQVLLRVWIQVQILKQELDDAQAFPLVIVDEELSTVTDEWKTYLLYGIDSEDDIEKVNVNDYWSKAFERRNSLGNLKFNTLGKVIKGCLALSHGNSDAERSFSANKLTVTPQRASLNEETINAIRLVKDGLRIHAGGDAAKIKVTSALLQETCTAYSKYKEFQEECKRKEAEK